MSVVVDNCLVGTVYAVVSPYKTGTTSVGKALVELGAGRRDMPYRQGVLKPLQKHVRRWRRIADSSADFQDFVANHTEEVRADFADLTAVLAGFDVFHDAPFGHAHLHPFVRKVIAPDAKMIWVNRNFPDWVDSVRNWEITHPHIYKRHTEWETDPDLRINSLRKVRQMRRREFRRLARAVPEDCLELNMKELADYSKLADFCGVQDPGGALTAHNVSRG